MAVQALGYAGFGSAAIEDWRQFGTGLVGLQAVERGNSLLVVSDGRPQAAHRHRPFAARRRALFRLGSGGRHRAGCASGPAGRGQGRGHRRAARCWRTPGGVRALISFSDPAGNRLEAFYGPEIDDTPFLPRPFDLRLPHRSARPRPRRADGREHRSDDGVLCRRARLRPLRLYPKAVSRLFLSRQRAASLAGADRDRQAAACTI